MVKSMFSGVSGLRSHQQKMDVIANNISNVNTWGYKAATYSFKDAVYQTINASTGGDGETGGMGGTNASQLGYGTATGSVTTSFTSGAMATSDSPLDCMIDGTGFFIVGPMNSAQIDISTGDLSASGLYLSRVGIFSTDNNGYLVDSSGYYVYGAQSGTVGSSGTEGELADTISPICIPDYVPADGDPVGKTSYDIQSYSISADGTLLGVDKDTNRTIVIGQIALAAVENPNGLEKTSGYYYSIGDNAGDVTGNLTNGGALGRIKSGYLEQANVDLAKEFSEMITTQRGFQANSKIITVSDEMLEQLVNMKR
ncbi:flagellar hook-basal body protein [Parasporobacterium paucivorans]|uniref:Flagellar hook protein FlgE n=1 Tax=Parasporobacterium paucivorans DSM 15970 TaxID=1122934 RepID=A0A1M6I8E2_9FIRM|nr:flagellar hook-basal body complex protein [Parasporobacterium paucivorans]SHJ30715.1 flagellar hook protein FlgE [Parasporobacterium paucivorans DSM 15970]